MNWRIKKQTTLATTPVFKIEEVILDDEQGQTPRDFPYYRIQAPSWVNIFALTKDREAILVRQPRIGMMQLTLEVPGGGIELGEDPAHAAIRELEEETGYRAGRIQSIGVISPNPAIMTNRLHMFIAEDCYRPNVREYFPDSTERIEIVTLPLNTLDEEIKNGGIHNALAALTILMGQKYFMRG